MMMMDDADACLWGARWGCLCVRVFAVNECMAMKDDKGGGDGDMATRELGGGVGGRVMGGGGGRLGVQPRVRFSSTHVPTCSDVGIRLMGYE